VETDGTVAGWGERKEEALLTVTRGLLPHLLARPLHTLTDPAQLWQMVRREDLPDAERDAWGGDRFRRAAESCRRGSREDPDRPPRHRGAAGPLPSAASPPSSCSATRPPPTSRRRERPPRAAPLRDALHLRRHIFR